MAGRRGLSPRQKISVAMLEATTAEAMKTKQADWMKPVMTHIPDCDPCCTTGWTLSRRLWFKL